MDQNPRGNTLEFHPQGTSLRMDSRQYHQGDLEETNVSLEPSRYLLVAHDGIRIVVTSVRITLSNLKVQHLKDLLESRCSCSGAST